MPEEEKAAPGETPEQPAEPVAPVAAKPVVPPSDTPASEDDFDKERAMNTIKTLRDIEKQAKKDAKELEALRAEKQEREQAEMTDLQKAQKRIAELEAKQVESQRALWRNQAATEANLPSIFAERVQGETLEEMQADAKKLAEALPKAKQNPRIDPTNPANGEKAESLAEKKARLFGPQGQNYFDPAEMLRQGGGVVWTGDEAE